MKKIIIFIILIGLFNCNKNPISPIEKKFNPKDLDNLSLENISIFWQDDSFEVWIDPIAHFTVYEGYLKGIELRSDKKCIGVFVFNGKKTAIEAMEEFRSLISAMTYVGEKHELIKEKWWYIKGNPYYAIYINEWNTIVEIIHNYPSNENIIVNTALEVTERIDVNSN